MSNVVSKGKISQIIGAVVDVSFPAGEILPKIYDALRVVKQDGGELILECQQDIGENTVRTIAMDSTDGLQRGLVVENMGEPISMSVGEEINGRLSYPQKPSKIREFVHLYRGSFHRYKGHRPDRTLCKGRKDRSVRRSGRRQDGIHPGDDKQHC